MLFFQHADYADTQKMSVLKKDEAEGREREREREAESERYTRNRER